LTPIGLQRSLAAIVGFDLVEYVRSRDSDGPFATTTASPVSHVVGTLAHPPVTRHGP
jgi:hypothetical protein